jgi:hypothetical protein
MIRVWYDQDFVTNHTYGKWINVNNRYLGLKFKIKGKFHYGWARLSVHNFINDISATLTGYAYETIPNKPIITGKTKGEDDSSVEQPNPADPSPDASLTDPIPAPQPASLGALAMGARVLSIWRRKELTLETH